MNSEQRTMRDNIIIFSSTNKQQTKEEREIANDEVISALLANRIQFVPAIGKYNDTLEYSYILSADHVAIVAALMERYNQDSYMLLENQEVDGSRAAWLVTYDNGAEVDMQQYIGHLRAIPKEDIVYYSEWTYRPDVQQYYAVRRIA